MYRILSQFTTTKIKISNLNISKEDQVAKFLIQEKIVYKKSPQWLKKEDMG